MAPCPPPCRTCDPVIDQKCGLVSFNISVHWLSTVSCFNSLGGLLVYWCVGQEIITPLHLCVYWLRQATHSSISHSVLQSIHHPATPPLVSQSILSVKPSFQSIPSVHPSVNQFFQSILSVKPFFQKQQNYLQFQGDSRAN